MNSCLFSIKNYGTHTSEYTVSSKIDVLMSPAVKTERETCNEGSRRGRVSWREGETVRQMIDHEFRLFVTLGASFLGAI